MHTHLKTITKSCLIISGQIAADTKQTIKSADLSNKWAPQWGQVEPNQAM